MMPELQIGSWSLPTYFLIISLDFCLLLLWIRWQSARQGLLVETALDVGILSSIIGMVGARLFHIVYEAPEYYQAHPWAIFRVWEGGFVFLAGVLCGLAFGVWWLRRRRLSPLVWLDFYAPVLALGYSLGRWACFFQGCCYGSPTDSIWGLHSEHEPHILGRYPTQLFASFGEVILFFILLGLQKQKSFSLKPGQLFAIWLFGHGVNRMGMEVFRDDPRGPLWAGMGVSFWLAAGMVLVGLSYYLYRSGRVSFGGRRS